MRSLFVAIVILVVAAGCSGSDESTSSAEDDSTDAAVTTVTTTAAPVTSKAPDPVPLRFTVDGVASGGTVPIEYTCDGANDTPTLTIDEVPTDVEELALVVDDPDAPTESPFVHWVVYGISADAAGIADGDGSLRFGVTDAGTESWFGPCPPPGDGPHTYQWRLFGLSSTQDLEPGLDGRDLEESIAGAVATEAILTASYERAN